MQITVAPCGCGTCLVRLSISIETYSSSATWVWCFLVSLIPWWSQSPLGLMAVYPNSAMCPRSELLIWLNINSLSNVNISKLQSLVSRGRFSPYVCNIAHCKLNRLFPIVSNVDQHSEVFFQAYNYGRNPSALCQFRYHLEVVYLQSNGYGCWKGTEVPGCNYGLPGSH